MTAMCGCDEMKTCPAAACWAGPRRPARWPAWPAPGCPPGWRSPAGAYTGDTLVVLSLRGGFDGLSAVAPIGDPDYYRGPARRSPCRRPRSSPATARSGCTRRWRRCCRCGRAARWPPCTRSASRTRPARTSPPWRRWNAPRPAPRVRTGWLDRMLGVAGADRRRWPASSLGNAMPARLLAGPAPAVSMASVDDFTLAGDEREAPDGGGAARDVRGRARRAGRAGPAPPTRPYGDRRGAAAAGYTPANGAAYPDTAAGRRAARRGPAGQGEGRPGRGRGRLRRLGHARGARHRGQGPADVRQPTELAAALAAFATDLGADGMAKVTLVTVSEFGRRVAGERVPRRRPRPRQRDAAAGRRRARRHGVRHLARPAPRRSWWPATWPRPPTTAR